MPRALRQLISLPAAVALAVAHVIALWSAAFYSTNWTEPSWTTNSFKCQRWSRRTRKARSSRAAFTLILPKGRGDLQSLHCTQECCQNAQITKLNLNSSRRRVEAPLNAGECTTAICHLWMCREKPTAHFDDFDFKKEKGFILVLENTLQQYR